MKFLFLFLLVTSSSYAANLNDLKNIPNNTCFIDNYRNKLSHKWEKQKNKLPWVFIEKDATAIRIAQPSSFCNENEIPLRDCKFYWDRTIEFKDPAWNEILKDISIMKCPDDLKGKQLTNRLK